MTRIIFFALALLVLNGCTEIAVGLGDKWRSHEAQNWCKAHPELAGPGECKTSAIDTEQQMAKMCISDGRNQVGSIVVCYYDCGMGQRVKMQVKWPEMCPAYVDV